MILEQVLAMVLVKSILSEQTYDLSKHSYVVDNVEIEEIKKEVAVLGLKAKREWKELDEVDIITMTS